MFKAKTELISQIEFDEALNRILGDKQDLLYPNSPIEVIVDFTTNAKDTGRQWHFCVMAEGEWVSNERTVFGVNSAIRELIKVHRDLWGSECLRMHPDWAGWSKLNMGTLLEIIGGTCD